MTPLPTPVQPHIIKDNPPNIEAIRAAFPGIMGRKGVVFAWLDVIYNPDGVVISPAIIAHETIHLRQQRATGGAESWWERYIADPSFRLSQELEASRAEIDAFALTSPAPNRLARARYHAAVVERLSSQMYGYMIRRKDVAVALKAKDKPDVA